MRADAAAYKPFLLHFQLHVLEQHASKRSAEMSEQQLIAELNTTSTTGYNKLPGAPKISKDFWIHHHRRNKAKRS